MRIHPMKVNAKLMRMQYLERVKLVYENGVPTTLPIMRNPATMALWSIVIGREEVGSIIQVYVGEGQPSIMPYGIAMSEAEKKRLL